MVDPYEPHLRQADGLFAQGEIVKAGQIWQAILKRDPQHQAARDGLLLVKQRLLELRQAAEPEPPPIPVPPPSPAPTPMVEAPPPAQAAPPPLPPPAPVTAPTGVTPEPAHQDPHRLVIEGCTLYDMGQIEDALKKWELVLTLDPDHRMAREYANGARRELGMALLEAPDAPQALASTAPEDDEDVDKLLREAVQLYDMGLIEEAITKWERVLAAEPHRKDVETYLRQARTETGLAAQPSAPSPAPTKTPFRGNAPAFDPTALDLKLRQAEHLITLQRPEEAAFTYQQALAMDPGNALALQGLERCRRPVKAPLTRTDPVLTLDDQGRIAMAEEPTSASGVTEPRPVEPPAALIKAAPAPREGLSLPERFQQATENLPWLRDPKVLVIAGSGLLVAILVLTFVHGYRKDQELKDAVQAARAAALAPLAQQSQAPDLLESPATVRQEIESALGVDPLRAYLRATTLVRLDPAASSGAQLLERARAGLVGGITGASLAEYQKHLQNGDLEAAAKVVDTLLRAEPDNADLRRRSARLQLSLSVAHASQGKWDEAAEDLQRGRALFPEDKTWQARLFLLERVRTLPKGDQTAWISLLG